MLLLFGHRLPGCCGGGEGAGMWDTSGSSCVTHCLQEQVPHVPAGPGGGDPGHVCFPLTHSHGAQEVHKGWVSHFQPGPWLWRDRRAPSFPVASREAAVPLTHPGTGRHCLSLSTSSKPQISCGALVFSTHPGLQLCARAASFPGTLGLPESHARACRDQILSGAGAEGQVLPSASLCTAMLCALQAG